VRKTFNWSLLDRSILYSMLYKAKPFIVGKNLTPLQFQKIISSHVKEHLPIKVTKKYGISQQRGLVYLGGVYYAGYDEVNSTQIELILSYHPLDETVNLSDYKWKKLCNLFADTILHEIVHMKQYRSRNFKVIKGYESTAQLAKQRVDQAYYGHKDEIGAFSFNIACELHDRCNGDANAVSEYLNSNDVKKHKRSTYFNYLKAFNWDHDHKIIRKLKRKIIQQLPNAAMGKPFASVTHLNY
jgi:hypothetical protein